MIRGDNIRDMSKAVAEKLGSSLKNAERVVRTETSHIHNTAEIEAYKAAGYEEYEFMASLGERTCPTCGGMDGKRFKLSDKADGLNFPPLHPNCRCTTVCWDEADEEQKALEGQRALDYEEWYRKYVEGREQPKLESKGGATVELPKQPVPTMPTENNEKIVGKSIDKTAESGIMNNTKVAIHPDKINKFCLKPDAKHADDFFNVGYTTKDYDLLYNDIVSNFDENSIVDVVATDSGAVKFNVFMD